MDIDQARSLVALHDNVDRAVANLRNANAMSTDDPRAPQLLEEAGDAYAESMAALVGAQAAIISGSPAKTPAAPASPAQPSGTAPGAEEPAPGGGQRPTLAEAPQPSDPNVPVDAPSVPEKDIPPPADPNPPAAA